MAIDGEPKDGDYVRYVEQLINRGQAAPGQVVMPTRGAAALPAASPSPGEVISDTMKRANTPGSWWKTIAGQRKTAPSSPAATTHDGQTADITLAARAAKRRGSLAITLVALAIIWQAMRILFEALRQPDFTVHELIPVAFLLVFAGILWKAARSQRTRANRAPGRLPPLTTISNRGTGKPGR